MLLPSAWGLPLPWNPQALASANTAGDAGANHRAAHVGTGHGEMAEEPRSSAPSSSPWKWALSLAELPQGLSLEQRQAWSRQVCKQKKCVRWTKPLSLGVACQAATENPGAS